MNGSRRSRPASLGRRCTAAVHVVDRSAHAVPVEASATVAVAVAVADGRAWRRGRGLDAEHLAAVALDGALRVELAARPLHQLVGPGRAELADAVRRRVGVDLEPLGLVVLGLWLGEVGDPSDHLRHWAGVQEAVVAAAARVEVAAAERDAVVAEHALAVQSWAAWRVSGLVGAAARAEVGAAAARADHAPALAAATLTLVAARTALASGRASTGSTAA